LDADNKLSPEVKLLLAIVSLFARGQACDGIAEYGPIDWEHFLKAAYHHGVLPLVDAHLKKCNCIKAPPSTVIEFSDHAVRNVRHNLFLSCELFKLETALAKRNLKFISFKGLVLAQLAYGDIALRMFADLDVFLQRECISRVHEALVEGGFTPTQGAGRPGPALYTRLQHEQEFRGANWIIDVHWELQPSFLIKFSQSQIDAHTVETELLGQSVLAFTPELQFLLACANGTKNYWSKIVNVLDVACLLQLAKIDWQTVAKLIEETGSQEVVRLSLNVVHRLLGISPPAQLKHLAEPHRELCRVMESCIECLDEFADIEQTGLAPELKLPLYWMINRSFTAKLRFVLKGIFVPTIKDWRALPLTQKWFGCYYLLRPLRLAFERMR
jgi:hypothetical protein